MLAGGMGRKLSSLKPEDGTEILRGLALSLSRSSTASYYAAFRRMLALSGVSTVDWPKAPKAPRKVKAPVEASKVLLLIETLIANGWGNTAQLIRAMQATGMRVEVEALSGGLQMKEGMLRIEAGKGGHERLIPTKADIEVDTSITEKRYGGLTYEGHLRRINTCCKALGICIKPHDLRRMYVKDVYEANGKDIRVAQVLAGHADPGTTAGYIGVDYGALK
jgi:integrase